MRLDSWPAGDGSSARSSGVTAFSKYAWPLADLIEMPANAGLTGPDAQVIPTRTVLILTVGRLACMAQESADQLTSARRANGAHGPRGLCTKPSSTG